MKSLGNLIAKGSSLSAPQFQTPKRSQRRGGLEASQLESLIIGILVISLLVPLIGIWRRANRLKRENAAVEPLIQEVATLTDRTFPKPAAHVKIDFCLAGIPELLRVPGIGTGTVEKLVKARAEAERPVSVDELRTLEGIGPRKWELLGRYFVLSPDPLPPMPRLNLNKTTAGELEVLPGIGPTLAFEIIATRNRLGGFSSMDDLQEVPGLTETGFQRFASLVTLE